jgi:hypothetical protein
MISPLVGGWESAAQLPAQESFAFADEHFQRETVEAHRHAQLCWHSALPLYAMGGTPPDPPVLDDFEDED